LTQLLYRRPESGRPQFPDHILVNTSKSEISLFGRINQWYDIRNAIAAQMLRKESAMFEH
jgi:hypothetical protein